MNEFLWFLMIFFKKINFTSRTHYIEFLNVMISPRKVEIFSKKSLKTKGNHSLEKLNFNISYIEPSLIFPSAVKINVFAYQKVRVRIEC